MGVKRLERDVLDYKPDLVIVCYGLNDASRGDALLDTYEKSLAEIFERVTQTGAEVNFYDTQSQDRQCDRPTGDSIIDDVTEAVIKNETDGWL